MKFSLHTHYATSFLQDLPLLEEISLRLKDQRASGGLGFAQLPYQTQEQIQEIQDLANHIRSEFSDLIVVGIGGSDLGARAVHRALNHQFYNQRETSRIFFVGDTTDPDAISEVLDVVDISKAAVVVISKSGSTIEQMSTYLYLAECLQKSVGDAWREHCFFITDPSSGTLRKLMQEEGFKGLSIPPEVGGRFSVLSAAGLLPLAVTGVSIIDLLSGAREMDEHIQQSPQNVAAQYALLHNSAYHAGHIMHVLMPYRYCFREFSLWYRQLWAESLGKNEQASPTPISALGPTDQHSQLQLYMEGANDKVFTFITTESTNNDGLRVPHAEEESLSYLSGHHFSDILQAEYQSTAYALHEAGRPSCTIVLPEISAASMGRLLFFYEYATAYFGEFLQIDAYNQPGVEASKKYMYGILGREGYDSIVESKEKNGIISF